MTPTQRFLAFFVLIVCGSGLIDVFAEPPFRGRLVQEPVERFLPPLLTPIPDGFYTETPAELGNQKLAEKGFLDVTASPFLADPSGKKDSTAALQAAIDFSRDHSLVCFFPPGVYRVSETLVCRTAYRWRSHSKAVEPGKSIPIALMGSRKGEGTPGFRRPRIVLSRKSAGFQDTDRPSYVVDFQIFSFNVGGERQSMENKEKGIAREFKMNFAETKYNSLFNHVFVHLDIEIEPGNPGAIGLRMNSAEGSGVQEVMVEVGDGFAGLEGGSGNGGSWNDIEVRGGRFGLDLGYGGVPTPVVSALKLSGQRECAIRARVRGSLVIAGMDLLFSGSGAALDVPTAGEKKNLDGAVTIVDARVVFEKPSLRFVQAPDANLYLRNISFQNVPEIDQATPGNPSGWVRLAEYARGLDFTSGKESFGAAIFWNAGKTQNIRLREQKADQTPKDPLLAHALPVPFPNFESEGAADVRRYGAKGDSFTDDTDAIQKAIEENKIVFIPKGYFRISRSLRLKPDTQLVGASHVLSVLFARDPEPSEKTWALVETADGREAKNILAFLGLQTPRELRKSAPSTEVPVYALKWSSGPESVFRSLNTHPLRVYGFIGDKEHVEGKMMAPKILVTENAGGRYYNFPVEDGFMALGNDYRTIRIEGAKGPLSFYGFEPQQALNQTYAEIRGARDLSIYGFKSEGNAVVLSVSDSDRIFVYGYGGLATGPSGGALMRFENTPNWLVANLCDQFNTGAERKAIEMITYHFSKYVPIEEVWKGETIRLKPNDRPVVAGRGE